MSDQRNRELIAQASAGNMGPLLKALRHAPMSGKPTHNVTQDMEPPDTELWFAVNTAVSDGELTNAQWDQCYSAIAAR